jgi:protein-S-isoprenylcysteine O-methyltransferase Ste14
MVHADRPATDHPDVLVFPPVIPATGFLGGVLLNRVWPLVHFLAGPLRTPLRVAGAVVLCAGAAGFAWMVATMRRARTPIHTAATPTTLVETGPFRFTRNPMYLFGSIAYAGLALLLIEPWSLALLPIVFALTHYGVVLREEAFLARRFGAEYARYRSHVRRWL